MPTVLHYSRVTGTLHPVLGIEQDRIERLRERSILLHGYALAPLNPFGVGTASRLAVPLASRKRVEAPVRHHAELGLLEPLLSLRELRRIRRVSTKSPRSGERRCASDEFLACHVCHSSCRLFLPNSRKSRHPTKSGGRCLMSCTERISRAKRRSRAESQRAGPEPGSALFLRFEPRIRRATCRGARCPSPCSRADCPDGTRPHRRSSRGTECPPS